MQQRASGEATYFLTFTTYGTRLPGDERGTTDRRRNAYGTPREGPNAGLEYERRQAMRGDPVTFSQSERELAHRTVLALAEHRAWHLHALNVRSNHVHAVVWADEPPLQVIQGMKAWVTRRLVEAGHRGRGAELWTTRGSRRFLWDEASISRAIDYVLFMQDY
ncbi:MAG: hypothetical protein WED87_08795 [Dehalococcoidia bacterium]